MDIIDIIILGVGVLAAVYGAVRGFVHQAGTIAAVVCAILVCRFFGSRVADVAVTAGAQYEGVWRMLVYILLFVVVYAGVRLVASFFTAALQKLHVRVLDRIAGAVFSLGVWMLVLSLLLNVYLAVAPADRAKFSVGDKPWRGATVQLAPKVLGYITTSGPA